VRRLIALGLACLIAGPAAAAAGARATTLPDPPPLGTPVAVRGVASLTALACGTPATCLALGEDTEGDWVVVPIDAGRPGTAVPVPAAPGDELTLTALACGSATLCEAVGSLTDSQGDSLAAVVTVAGGQPGAPQPVADPNGTDGADDALSAVGCPSASTCEAVGEGEDAQSVEIDAGTPGELAHDADPEIEQLDGIVCAAGSCAALGAGSRGNGIVVPVSGGTLGGTQPVADAGTLSSAACAPGTSTCELLGADERGRSLVVPDQGGVLGAPEPLPGELTGVACPSATSCAAIGTSEDGGGIVVPFAGAVVGLRTAFPLAPVGAPVCVSATSCAAIGTIGADGDPALVPFGAIVTEVALNVGSPRVSRTTVSLPLTCALACAGSIVETASLTASAHSRLVPVGRARFSLAAGAHDVARVHLDERGRRLLADRRRLDVELVVRSAPGASSPVAAIRAATLRAGPSSGLERVSRQRVAHERQQLLLRG
jgi:hypothetical protein